MFMPFYVRTSRLGDDIMINGHRYNYPRAGIFCELLNSNTPFPSPEYSRLMAFLKSIKESPSPLLEIAKIQSQIDALLLSPLLKALLLWQPANEAAQADSTNFSRVDYSGYERQLVTSSVPPMYDATQSAFLREHSPLRWRVFFSILANCSTENFSKEEVSTLLDCFDLYLTHFQGMSLYLQRLFLHLESYLSLTPSQEEELARIFTSPTFTLTSKAVFPDEKLHVQYSPTYVSKSLPELLAVEFYQYGLCRDKITQCKLCQKYFLISRKNSAYCPSPNLRFNGRTCSEAASLLSLISKTADYPMQPTFNTACKTYAKWCRDNDAWCRKHIKDSAQKKTIIDSLYQNYEEWKSCARHAQKAFSVGYITKEALIDALTLPDIVDRSPELAEWKLSHRK